VRDIDRGASVGGPVEWDHVFGRVPVTLVTRLRQHADLKRGLQADVQLSAGILRSGRVGVGVYMESIWANAKSIDGFYGVSPVQTPTTGLPAFAGTAGWLTAVSGVGARLDLSRNWVAVAEAETHQLLGAVTRSPLVERTGNYYLTLGIAVRF
jgi:outer membrane protein